MDDSFFEGGDGDGVWDGLSGGRGVGTGLLVFGWHYQRVYIYYTILSIYPGWRKPFLFSFKLPTSKLFHTFSLLAVFNNHTKKNSGRS